MTDREHRQDLKPLAGSVCALAAGCAVALIIGLAAVIVPRPAGALPSYAQQTGMACGRCHVSPAGGGPRTAFGNAFAANGHKVPAAGAKPGKSSGGTTGPAPAAPPSGTVYNYAQAGAWSLRHPYYSHFLYRSDDYSK
jgi:hypothetical protein